MLVKLNPISNECFNYPKIMEYGVSPYFVTIDDDRIDNMLYLRVIRQTVPDAYVKSFTDPEIGVDYIRSKSVNADEDNVILLLDINMPTLSGWDVLEKFKNFPYVVRNQIKIFIMSSSGSQMDEDKARSNPLVSGFIHKPLTSHRLQSILQDEKI